jgi:signal transduction histidine kinase
MPTRARSGISRAAGRLLTRPRSLRWRLTAWVATVMLVAAALVFVVVYTQTGTTLEGQIDTDLREDVSSLYKALRSGAAHPSPGLHATAVKYVTAQPYRANATLLFALLGASAPISNHPELFGGVNADDGEPPTRQQAENREGARLLTPRLGYSVQEVPDVGDVRVLERAFVLGGSRAILGAAEPLASVHAAREGIARAFALAGSLSLLLALLASYLAGARVTAPLRRMASVAARVDGGDLEPRMEETAGSGAEMRVLADSFNHMLDRLAIAFARQREFIADASHELRTPLTVIRGQLEVLAAAQDPSTQEVNRVERVVQAEVTRMARLVDDLLLLTAAEQTDFLRLETIELRQFVTELWDGLSLTAERRFELGEVPAGTLRADPDRLAQALRNLGRNSVEHTRQGDGLVRLEVEAAPGEQVRFSVIDDGLGIPPEDRERVFERLYRTDPSRSRSGQAATGAGLGLAIVRAIAQAHGGAVRAGAGPGDLGTRIDLLLPGFRRTLGGR